MARFRYEALDARGRVRRGELEAEHERAARRLLKREGLVPRSVAPAAGARAGAALRVRLGEWRSLFEQLAVLLEAGAPLAEALAAIAEHEEGARVRALAARLHGRVLEGAPLAEALAGAGAPEALWRMVQAGEEAGALAAVCARIAEMLAARLAAREELLSIALYPMIVLAAGVVVAWALLAFVVPQVARVFAHAHAELPLVTRIVLAASAFARDWGGWLLLALLAAAAALVWARRRPALRARMDALLLRVPLLGRLWLRAELARAMRTLGLLLGGGVPLLAALGIAAQGAALAPVRALLSAAREAVREGGTLSRALAASPLVPPLVVRFARMGEAGGVLDRMLLRVGEQMEAELARRIRRMLTLLEPLLVVLMAVGVGTMAAAILLPLVQMNELVR